MQQRKFKKCFRGEKTQQIFRRQKVDKGSYLSHSFIHFKKYFIY